MKGGDIKMENLNQKIEGKMKARETKVGNSWRPEPGEILEGIVEKLGDTITDFGDQSFMEVTTGLGKVTVWLNPILQEQVEAEEVSTGDHIAIKFIGMKKSRKGNRQYKDFVLVKE